MQIVLELNWVFFNALLFFDLKTNRSHTFAFTFHSREEKQKLSGCYSKHGRRHHGKIQERLSRGAFRLGRGELFNLISPLASHSASPLLLYPLISSSLPAPLLTSSSQHPGARLCTVFTNTRTHARERARHHRGDPEDYISRPKRSPDPIPGCWRNRGEKGWLMKTDLDGTPPRSETKDLATLPRHLRYPSDDITAARDLSNCDCD